MINSIDNLLKIKLEDLLKEEKISEAIFWEACRILEEGRIVTSEKKSFATLSIGPYSIASNLHISKKEYLLFIIQSLLPFLVKKENNSVLESIVEYILKPVFEIASFIINRSVFITDELEWEILLFIKKQNKIGIYPSLNEISLNISIKDPVVIEDKVKNLMELNKKVEILKYESNGYLSIV
jgi:hypothetical protein